MRLGWGWEEIYSRTENKSTESSETVRMPWRLADNWKQQVEEKEKKKFEGACENEFRRFFFSFQLSMNQILCEKVLEKSAMSFIPCWSAVEVCRFISTGRWARSPTQTDRYTNYNWRQWYARPIRMKSWKNNFLCVAIKVRLRPMIYRQLNCRI